MNPGDLLFGLRAQSASKYRGVLLMNLTMKHRVLGEHGERRRSEPLCPPKLCAHVPRSLPGFMVSMRDFKVVQAPMKRITKQDPWTAETCPRFGFTLQKSETVWLVHGATKAASCRRSPYDLPSKHRSWSQPASNFWRCSLSMNRQVAMDALSPPRTSKGPPHPRQRCGTERIPRPTGINAIQGSSARPKLEVEGFSDLR